MVTLVSLDLNYQVATLIAQWLSSHLRTRLSRVRFHEGIVESLWPASKKTSHTLPSGAQTHPSGSTRDVRRTKPEPFLVLHSFPFAPQSTRPAFLAPHLHFAPHSFAPHSFAPHLPLRPPPLRPSIPPGTLSNLRLSHGYLSICGYISALPPTSLPRPHSCVHPLPEDHALDLSD